jgi:hypothetical protein
MPHVFPMFADILPEARRALEAIAAFVHTHLPARTATEREG